MIGEKDFLPVVPVIHRAGAGQVIDVRLNWEKKICGLFVCVVFGLIKTGPSSYIVGSFPLKILFQCWVY